MSTVQEKFPHGYPDIYLSIPIGYLLDLEEFRKKLSKLCDERGIPKYETNALYHLTHLKFQHVLSTMEGLEDSVMDIIGGENNE